MAEVCPLGTLVELLTPLEGTTSGPRPLGAQSAGTLMVPAGAIGMVHPRTGGLKLLINPVARWHAGLIVQAVRTIGRIRCLSSARAILTLDTEYPEGHEYLLAVPRAPGRAAQTRLDVFTFWLQGDMGCSIRLGHHEARDG